MNVFLAYGAPGIKSSSEVTGLFNTAKTSKGVLNTNLSEETFIKNCSGIQCLLPLTLFIGLNVLRP